MTMQTARCDGSIFRRAGVLALCAATLSACGGGAGAKPAVPQGVPAGTPRIQQGMPQPFNPRRDSLSALHRAALRDVSSTFPVLATLGRRQSKTATRRPSSTIPAGDNGFFAGIATQDAVTAIYSITSAYTASQFSIAFPASADQTPPVNPERVFGPEIDPGASCLLAGMVMVNFGPGGTQRNGAGNPVESLTGPYNAYRVIDLCNPTPNAQGQPQPATFFLTPIDDAFVAKYVRPNESGLPAMVSEVFSSNADAFTNASATWYAILWNFQSGAWDISRTSTGNVGGPGIPGDVMAYSSPVNAPEPCPAVPPLIAQDTWLLDPGSGVFVEAGFDESGLSTRETPAGADPAFAQFFNGGPDSTACFSADQTGPASLTFDFIPGKANADWILKQAAAQPPAP